MKRKRGTHFSLWVESRNSLLAPPSSPPAPVLTSPSGGTSVTAARTAVPPDRQNDVPSACVIIGPAEKSGTAADGSPSPSRAAADGPDGDAPLRTVESSAAAAHPSAEVPPGPGDAPSRPAAPSAESAPPSPAVLPALAATRSRQVCDVSLLPLPPLRFLGGFSPGRGARSSAPIVSRRAVIADRRLPSPSSGPLAAP